MSKMLRALALAGAMLLGALGSATALNLQPYSLQTFGAAYGAATALPGATVTIYLYGTTTKANLYNSVGGPLPNPLTADSNGIATFWADSASVYQAVWSLGAYTSPTVYFPVNFGPFIGSNLSGLISCANLPGLTGDVTTAAGSCAAAIAAHAVTNAKLAQMPAHTYKGNNTGAGADALDLTQAQMTAELNAVVGDAGSGGVKGLVPAPGAGDAAANKFLGAGGAFVIPPSRGVVTMTRKPYGNSALNSDGYNWIAYGPDSSVICDTRSSSTTTSCLQEATNYAFANQMALEVDGGPQQTISATEYNYARITTTTTWSIPPGTNAYVKLKGVGIYASVGASPVISIDSQDMGYFDFGAGQIINVNGTGRTIYINPVNPNQEAFTGITNTQFVNMSPVCTNLSYAPISTQGIGLEINPGATSVSGNRFHMAQINQCLFGFQIDNPTGPPFTMNQIDANYVNGQGSASFQIGTSATSGKIVGNWLNVSGYSAGSSGFVNIWGQSNTIVANVISGVNGIVYNTGATGNTLITSYLGVSGSPIIGGASYTCLGAGCPNWITYTPTISCASGSLTSYSATGRYSQAGKNLSIYISVTLTNVGTCAGSISASVPNSLTPPVPQLIHGRENAATGKALQAYWPTSSSNFTIQDYAGGIPIVNGYNLVVEGAVETN